MPRFVVIDAPIDCSGRGRGEERAPQALRTAGLLERLGARDGGEIDCRIRNSERDPATGVIGADEVRSGAREIAARVTRVLDAGDLPIVVGGDCTLLIGVFSALPPPTALCFIDGHADFFDGETSPTGEAADMDLAILTGHGPVGLLESDEPLASAGDVILLGHRPGELHPDVALENARLDPAIFAVTAPEIEQRGAALIAIEIAARLGDRQFWLHLDLDVLDEDEMPAVSYPQRLGLGWQQVADLLAPAITLPGLAGISIADFNPDRDPGGAHATRTVEWIARILSPIG